MISLFREWTGGGSPSSLFMHFLEAPPKLHRELLVALLASWLGVKLVKLGLWVQPLVADGTGKMVLTPGLVQGSDHVSSDHLVANETKVPERKKET